MNTQPLTPQSAGITGPMNINAVITHLIEMTPGQRKLFAQMHMDDPMMLSAAKFVDNQVNKQAQSLAAQQTGAAPPPVNQQAVAQMAGSPMPEDTGIAQLPAENMPSEYAGGGIVAFAEGDVVRGMPVSAQTAAMYREAGQTGTSLGTGVRESLQAANASLTDAGTSYLKAKIERNEPLTGVEKAQAKRAGLIVPVAVSNRGVPALLNKDAPAYTGPSAPPAKAKDDKVKRDPANYAPAETVPQKKVGIDQLREDRVESAPSAPVARQAPDSRAQAAPAAYKETSYVSPQSTGLENLLKGYQESQGPAEDPFAEKRAESGRARDKIAQEEMAGALEREKGIGTLLKGKEARIAGREERLNQQESMDLNMSIINAGLAMMQSTGKGLAGIAEGAQKGVGQFTESLKLSEASRQKIEEARDAHDDLRFNLENMSSKEKQAARRAIEEAKILTTTESINALERDYGLKRADATALFGAKVNQIAAAENRDFQADQAAKGREFTGLQTDKQIAASAKESALSRAASAGQAAASRAQAERLASAPSAQERLYTRLGGGDIREGYKFATEERGAGRADKATLDLAREIVASAITPSQKSSPDYIAAQRIIQNALGSSTFNTLNVPDSSLRSRP
jgi:hypothetical protein